MCIELVTMSVGIYGIKFTDSYEPANQVLRTVLGSSVTVATTLDH